MTPVASREPAGSIVACTSASQAGWLTLRNQLWPHHDQAAHLAEMEAFCREPGRYAQFLFLAPGAQAVGLVELAVRSDYVHGASTSPVAYVEGLFVSPSHRRQGVARALLRRSETWALRCGCQELASDALLDNTASHCMHRALGFRETDRVVFFIKAVARDLNPPSSGRSKACFAAFFRRR